MKALCPLYVDGTSGFLDDLGKTISTTTASFADLFLKKEQAKIAAQQQQMYLQNPQLYPQFAPQPQVKPANNKKDNTLLYVGLAVGVGAIVLLATRR